ncbi:MAG: molybdenum cofactor cytidylyltransferase [Phototrophicaceae bacterium]
MKLHEAFEITRGDVVAFIGAGGKTSAMIGLGYELLDKEWRILATTTEAIDEEQLQLMPHIMHYDSNPDAISAALSDYGFVFLYDSIHKGKVYGPAIEWTRQLLDTIDSDVLLIEADSADGRPLKAPLKDEPYIPSEASLVVPIASLSALDQPLDDEHIYNSQAMIDKYGFYEGGNVRSPWIAQVLRDEDLGLRGIPDSARIVAYINRTPEDGYLRGRARLIAKLVLQSSRVNAVALGSIRAANPVYELQRSVGAIVLAAGQASRMGEPKLLLPWTKQHNILEHILQQLHRTRIDNICVVTGWYADDVRKITKTMGVKAVHNRAYKTGEMVSSLKTGLRAMPDNISAVLVVLGDQPRIEPKVLHQILNAYAEGQGDLIAPSYQMRRGHPILIGRKYWSELLSLRNYQSPREVINAHADEISYITVDTDSVLQDVDTPQDYKDERKRAGLNPKP